MVQNWDDDERNTKVHINYWTDNTVKKEESTSWYKEIARELDRNKWNYWDEVEYVDYTYEQVAMYPDPEPEVEAETETEVQEKPKDKEEPQESNIKHDIAHIEQSKKFAYT